MRKILGLLALIYGLAVPAVPTWRKSMTKGQWNVFPAATLNNSGAAYTTGGSCSCGTGNQIQAWGGAVLVTRGLYIGSTFTNGLFLVPWGGGHTDYGGNEMTAFGPIDGNAPTWNRLRDSTSPHPINVFTDGSGNPVSRHSYNSCAYWPDSAYMICIGTGFRFNDASTSTTTHVFRFNTSSPNTNQPWTTKAANSSGWADFAVSDLALGRIWFHGNGFGGNGNHVGYYTPSSNAYTNDGFRSPLGYGGNAMSALDSADGLIGLWDYANGISFFRTNNGTSNDYYRPTTTGKGPRCNGGSCSASGPDSANNCTIAWAATKTAFVLKCDRDTGQNSHSGNKDFWYLQRPATNPFSGGNAWTWEKIVPASGATPDANTANGIFGRLQWLDAADYRGMLLMNSSLDSMYFYLDSAATTASTNPAFFKALQGVGY